jgi:hypothetical protein
VVEIVHIIGENTSAVGTSAAQILDGLLLAAAKSVCGIGVEALLAVDLGTR